MSGIGIEHRGSVVISHWPAESSAEEVHAFFDQMELLLQARPRALVLNALEVKSAPIAVRDAAGRRLKVMAPLFDSRLMGQATVLRSPLVRGALATIHFFSPPRYPAQTFSDLGEAIAWAQARLGRSAPK